jgi:phosphatidylserine/phosphatidylglycerophosphate/cardiolipin synthase-like enzyme
MLVAMASGEACPKVLCAAALLLAALLSGCLGTAVPQPALQVNEDGLGVYFCPEDSCSARIVREIEDANNYVYIAAYIFTHEALADAVARAEARGVEVKVLLERENASSGYSRKRVLVNSGAEVREDLNPALMHNKFCVIDGRLVITGSFNYTFSADTKNDENLVFIRSGETAQRYRQKFEELFRYAS